MALTAAPRAAIVFGYAVVFWILLPGGLWLLAETLDRSLDWSAPPRPMAGGVALLLGLGLAGWAMVELWRRGHGWSIGALPPPCFTERGPYRHARHPLYVGFNLAIFGAGLSFGSPSLSWLVAPGFAPVWLVYARMEERGLVERFGERYRRYRRRVGILPRLDLYRVGQLLILMRVFAVRVSDREHVPCSGPVLLVANHACYIDFFYVSAVTRRRVHYLATAESYRNGLMRWLLSRTSAIPVRRYRTDPVACREVVRMLEAGEVVGVFPEGERSPLGDYQGALPEVASVLRRLSAPVVPIGVSGAYDSGPRWSDVVRRRRVRVRVGPPIIWDEGEPGAAIDRALRCLIEPDPQPVRLPGLPLERLGRVLWRCPGCLSERGWLASELKCTGCGLCYAPTEDGWFRDPDGRTWALAQLGHMARAAVEKDPLKLPASAWCERGMFGPIRPLEFVAEGQLSVGREGLRFDERFIPNEAMRSISIERADTLQVATSEEMLQFRLQQGSAFRLKELLGVGRGERLPRGRTTP